jgi:hypothetical protein
VEQHEKAMAGTVALIAALPEASPFTERVGASGGAAANGLIDTDVDFDEAGAAGVCVRVADRGDFADEDNAGHVGHLMESVFDGLRGGG